MMYPTNVERWRLNVRGAIARIVKENPPWKSLLDSLRLTLAQLEEVTLAIIQKESSGNPWAVGDNGNSIGLMQLNYGAGTPQDMGYRGAKEGLHNPDENIYRGVKYFLTQLARYRDLDKAILSYNAGSYRTTAAGVPVNPEYLQTVLKYLGDKLSTAGAYVTDAVSKTEKKTSFSSVDSSQQSTSSLAAGKYNYDRNPGCTIDNSVLPIGGTYSSTSDRSPDRSNDRRYRKFLNKVIDCLKWLLRHIDGH